MSIKTILTKVVPFSRLFGVEAVKGLEVDSFVLYQPDPVLCERLPSPEVLSRYVKRLEGICKTFFSTALFVPTNNGLPLERADVVAHARNADIARATENSVSVIRADVAGRTADLVSYGSTGIVDPGGTVLQSAQRLTEDLLVADLGTAAKSSYQNLYEGTRLACTGLTGRENKAQG